MRFTPRLREKAKPTNKGLFPVFAWANADSIECVVLVLHLLGCMQALLTYIVRYKYYDDILIGVETAVRLKVAKKNDNSRTTN